MLATDATPAPADTAAPVNVDAAPQVSPAPAAAPAADVAQLSQAGDVAKANSVKTESVLTDNLFRKQKGRADSRVHSDAICSKATPTAPGGSDPIKQEQTPPVPDVYAFNPPADAAELLPAMTGEEPELAAFFGAAKELGLPQDAVDKLVGAYLGGFTAANQAAIEQVANDGAVVREALGGGEVAEQREAQLSAWLSGQLSCPSITPDQRAVLGRVSDHLTGTPEGVLLLHLVQSGQVFAPGAAPPVSGVAGTASGQSIDAQIDALKKQPGYLTDPRLQLQAAALYQARAEARRGK